MKREEILSKLDEYKKNNREKYNILEMGIFGSVASETNNSKSDIDVVIKTKKADLFLMVHIKEELENIFKTNIDIVRYRKRMNKYLKNNIDHQAIYV
ncbi:MAG: nucleotidyltransferase domain-containing protein [Candidatus Marinimicrobia bacterium]|nr:nucleotidyltransferase domain-containing protein [Candidatus Neomarinimicrobiota bacterium]